MKILECSSRGDKRFSALWAKVEIFGVTDTIENHYQLSKRFETLMGVEVPQHWKDAKGKKPSFFEVDGQVFDLKHLDKFYSLMWVKYLDNHPELVRYARQFDDYNDMFKSKNSIVCQADVIRQYIKQGRHTILNECREFTELLREK